MTVEEMEALFNAHPSEHHKFDRVVNKLSQRPDVHAFILLDQLVPGKGDLVSAAEHDEYFINILHADLAAAATEEQIIDLIRCGLRMDEDGGGFAFFA